VNSVLIFIAIFVSPFSHAAFAGVIEMSYSFSRTDSRFDADNFSRSLSHTGSIAWYFMQMSAIEFSYTRGEGQVSGRPSSETEAIRYRTEMQLWGADLVVTLAKKEWAFQPYIKGGGALIDKKTYRLANSVSPGPETLLFQTDPNDPVPSMGAGFRLRLNEQFNIRASYDRWRSGNAQDTQIWDSAVRAGFSFMF